MSVEENFAKSPKLPLILFELFLLLKQIKQFISKFYEKKSSQLIIYVAMSTERR